MTKKIALLVAAMFVIGTDGFVVAGLLRDITVAAGVGTAAAGQLITGVGRVGCLRRAPTPGELAAAEVAAVGVGVAAVGAGVDTGRAEAWRAVGGDPEGTIALLHYAAMRLAKDLRVIAGRLPVDLGVMGAAAGAAQALTLLLEVTTIRSMDDPRAEHLTTTLARAQDELEVAAGRLGDLFAAGRSVAALIEEPGR